MNVTSTIDELSTFRINELKELILTLSDNKNINIRNSSRGRNIIYYVSDTFHGNLDFENNRFQTICEQFNASYYEIWMPMELNRTTYYLERAYLHLYNNDDSYLVDRQDGEFILLHSDPNISDTENHYKFKIGPHLHFMYSPNPINHSHWALALDSLDMVLSNRINFTNAYKNAFIQLRDQLFVPYNDLIYSNI